MSVGLNAREALKLLVAHPLIIVVFDLVACDERWRVVDERRSAVVFCGGGRRRRGSGALASAGRLLLRRRRAEAFCWRSRARRPLASRRRWRHSYDGAICARRGDRCGASALDWRSFGVGRRSSSRLVASDGRVFDAAIGRARERRVYSFGWKRRWRRRYIKMLGAERAVCLRCRRHLGCCRLALQRLASIFAPRFAQNRVTRAVARLRALAVLVAAPAADNHRLRRVPLNALGGGDGAGRRQAVAIDGAVRKTSLRPASMRSAMPMMRPLTWNEPRRRGP